MDTQHYMQELVARQLAESPEKVTDPQIELLTQLNREADLNSRAATAHAQAKVTNVDEASPTYPEVSESDRAVAAGSPVEFEPFPVPVLPETAAGDVPVPAEFISHPGIPAKAAKLFTEAGIDASVAPSDTSATDHAFPVPPTSDTSTQDATASKPIFSTSESASPIEAPRFFTEQAKAGLIESDPGVDVQANVGMRASEQSLVPHSLPFNFAEMLKNARNEIELPDITSGPKDLQFAMSQIPMLEPVDVQTTTEYAETRLTAMSRDIKNWERHV